MNRRGLRILLIEDNPAEARLLEISLQQASETIEVQSANCLEEGLRFLETTAFDAVLLDLSLPDSQGLSSLDRLGRRLTEIPVLVLTGLDNEDLARHAIRRGAQDYLVKGQADSRLLARAINYAIERNRMEAERRRTRDQAHLLLTTSVGIMAQRDAAAVLQTAVDAACLLTDAAQALALPWPDDAATAAGSTAVLAQSDSPSVDLLALVWCTGDGRRSLLHAVWHDVESLRLTRDELAIATRDCCLSSPASLPRGLLAVRLVGHDGSSTGLLLVADSRRGQFDEQDEVHLRQLAAITGLALQHVDARTAIERRADEAERARAALETSEERFRLAVNNIPDPLLIFDAAQRVEFVNTAATQLLGLSPAALQARCAAEIWPPETRQVLLPALEQAVQRRTPQRVEATIPRDGQPPIALTVTFVPLIGPAGDVHQVLGITHDITEHRRAEASLLEADRRKDEFLANISHELRTPMNAILGMTELALGEELSPVVRDYLETAKDSAGVLLALLNEILDFSRIKAGKIALESVPFSLGTVLDETLKVLTIRAYEKGLELACQIPLGVPDDLLGDPLRLRQIVTNLIGNAIKFTPQGQVVLSVALQAQDEAGATLEFSVSDTGIGISPENQQRIFAPFAQADSSTTRHYGGTGLGLTIAASLAQMMGGQLQVESALGEGSTFRFTCQLALLPPASRAPASVPPPGLAGTRVLVVDDNAAVRQIVGDLLQEFGMAVEQAADGQSALVRLHEAAVHEEPFALVLIDAVMPGIDGFTVGEWIERDGHLAQSVILMIPSTDRHVQARANRQTGHVTYLEKPVSRSQLLRAVSKALGVSVSTKRGGDRAGGLAGFPRPSRTLRVLLAEDTPANQKLIVHILHKRGHTVDIARDGREAAELVLQRDFDIVLMDVQMPVMDGFQATAAIRAMDEPTRAGLPIVALTAHAFKGDAERCLAAGMDGYLAKPINSRDLVQTVERVAAKSRA